MEQSIFQNAYSGDREAAVPPLKKSVLLQATSNVYALLKTANENIDLEWLEVAFTRCDSWDRQSTYPKFLPVKLKPYAQLDRDKSITGTGFTLEIGQWQDDHPDGDVQEFICHNIGYL